MTNEIKKTNINLNKKHILNIYVLDIHLNIDLKKYLQIKYNVLKTDEKYNNSKFNFINQADVILVSNVKNISEGLEIIDIALSMGKEIVCVMDKLNENYLAYILKKDGAISI